MCYSGQRQTRDTHSANGRGSSTRPQQVLRRQDAAVARAHPRQTRPCERITRGMQGASGRVTGEKRGVQARTLAAPEEGRPAGHVAHGQACERRRGGHVAIVFGLHADVVLRHVQWEHCRDTSSHSEAARKPDDEHGRHKCAGRLKPADAPPQSCRHACVTLDLQEAATKRVLARTVSVKKLAGMHGGGERIGRTQGRTHDGTEHGCR